MRPTPVRERGAGNEIMRIENIRLKNFRNVSDSSFAFDADRVLLLGPNGSGKSNLLEAISFLSVLRSFRGAPAREMVKLDCREFVISARIGGGTRRQLAVRENIGGARELFEDRRPVRKSSEFIRNFRTVSFAPEDRMIVSGGASYRRRFFDMLISVLEPKYFSDLGNCNRALKQRNRALRNGGKGADCFVPELIGSTVSLTAFRREYAAMVEREVNKLLGVSGKFGVRCRFSAPEDEGAFAELLEREREKELRRGVTLYGPHLDEFEFSLDGKPLRSCGSTGQIRLLSLFLKLAEFALVRKLADLPVLVLADDVTGELDAENARRFFELTQVADQAFFTFAIEPASEFFAGARRLALGGGAGL